MTGNILEESDSDNELPAEWLEQVESDGRIVYINLRTSLPQRSHPISGKQKRVSTQLPHDWFASTDSANRPVYINSISGRISYSDPRLAASSLSCNANGVLRRAEKPRFDRFSTVDEVLRGKDLRGQRIVITGSGCGLGRHVAISLAAHGAVVVCACSRSPINALPLTNPSYSRSVPIDGRIYWIPLDVTRLSSVIEFVQIFKSLSWPLHVLILALDVFPTGKPSVLQRIWNSTIRTGKQLLQKVVNWLGIFPHWPRYKWIDACECCSNSSGHTVHGLTSDGLEPSMQANYLTQVLLLYGLSPLLMKQSADGTECDTTTERPRIIWLSHESHRHVSPQWIECNTCRASPFSSVPSGFTGRLQYYALTKLFQLQFLAHFRDYLRSNYQYDGNQVMKLPLICVCNTESVLAMYCSAQIWYCFTQLLYDPWFSSLRLLRLAFFAFTNTLAQAVSTPCFCATDVTLPLWCLRDTIGLEHSGRQPLLCLDGCRRVNWFPLPKPIVLDLIGHTDRILSVHLAQLNSVDHSFGSSLNFVCKPIH